MPTIRQATNDDRTAVANLTNSYSNDTSGASPTPTDQIVLAEDDSGNAIGLVSLRVQHPSTEDASGSGEVTALYISPTYRRQKVAMLLLAEAERVSRDKGVADVTVRIDDTNATAAAFFRAMGYTPTDGGFKKQLPPKRSAKSRRAEG